MKTSREILKTIKHIEEEGKKAYMLGKAIDISLVMNILQLEYFANIARIKELLEKHFGEEPLDYEPESNTIEFRRDMDTTEWKKEENKSS